MLSENLEKWEKKMERKWRREGFEQGFKIGFEKGFKMGISSINLRILALKFPSAADSLTAQIKDKINDLSVDDIEKLMDKLLQASSIEEFLT